nr:PREDICTED: uncharacterized protein LOC108222581 [Daucus carota subsp. sativus]
MKMKSVKFYNFLNVKGLLVKCSEAGNVAAQHVLAKVILLSSTHLLLSEGKRKVFPFSDDPCDGLKLKRLIRDTNVPAQNSKVSSFMSYFSPLQVHTSDSPTRLVHHQLVKRFLINANLDDLIEMDILLRYGIRYLMSDTRENSTLIYCITKMVSLACYIGYLAKVNESFSDCLRWVREFLEVHSDRGFYKVSGKYTCLRHLVVRKCIMTAGLDSREALRDENFVEALRQEVSDKLGQSYIGLSEMRAAAVDHFENEVE